MAMHTYMVTFLDHDSEFVEVTEQVVKLGMAENSVRRVVEHALPFNAIVNIVEVPEECVKYRNKYQAWYYGNREIWAAIKLLLWGAKLAGKYPEFFKELSKK